MRRRLIILTALAVFLAGLAVPAAAKAPADLGSLLDAGLAASLNASENAKGLIDNPGHAKRAERMAAIVERLQEKFGEDHPGQGNAFGHLKAGELKANACDNPGNKYGVAKNLEKKTRIHPLGKAHPLAACTIAAKPEKPEGGDDDLDKDEGTDD